MELLVVFSVICCFCNPVCAYIRYRTGAHVAELTGGIFVDHLLWDVQAKTSRECAVACATDDRCVTFVLSEQPSEAPPKRCRGHSQGVDVLSSGISVNVPFARVYQLSERVQASGSTASAPSHETSTAAGGATSSDSETVSAHGTSSAAHVDTAEPASTPDFSSSDSSTPDYTSTSESLCTSVATTTEASTTFSTESESGASNTGMTTDSQYVTTTEIGEVTTVPQETTGSSSWLYSSCSLDDDCSQHAADASCVDLICVCTPGYYYSVSTATCPADCAEANLQQSYTEYADRYISVVMNPNDLGRLNNTTLEECITACSSDSRCRVLDFGNYTVPGKTAFINGCIMREVTALQISSWQFRSSNAWVKMSHYQKQCQ